MSIPDYPQYRVWIDEQKKKMEEAGRLKRSQLPSTQSAPAQDKTHPSEKHQTGESG